MSGFGVFIHTDMKFGGNAFFAGGVELFVVALFIVADNGIG